MFNQKQNDPVGSNFSNVNFTRPYSSKRPELGDLELRKLNFRANNETEPKIVVRWSNLEVEASVRGETKKILDNLSGQATNLEIVAILGPSGAGKSTLLNTIAGRTANHKGSVKFYANEERIGTFAYVPQTDQLPPYLTVGESLLYASKFKNSRGTNHGQEAKCVIDSFNLNSVKNHFTTKCSGGERKRLSIALEIISRPKILLLDEPTTGKMNLLITYLPKKRDKIFVFFQDSTVPQHL